MFSWGDWYCTDPAQHLRTAALGSTVDHLSAMIYQVSDMSDM